MTSAAIILAAGESSRMGRPKPLLPWVGATDGEPSLLIDYQVRELAAAGVDDIVVVLGHEAAELRPHVPPEARVASNEAYREGRASSLRAGAAALPDDAGPIAVLGVDQALAVGGALGAQLDEGAFHLDQATGGDLEDEIGFGMGHHGDRARGVHGLEGDADSGPGVETGIVEGMGIVAHVHVPEMIAKRRKNDGAVGFHPLAHEAILAFRLVRRRSIMAAARQGKRQTRLGRNPSPPWAR